MADPPTARVLVCQFGHPGYYRTPATGSPTDRTGVTDSSRKWSRTVEAGSWCHRGHAGIPRRHAPLVSSEGGAWQHLFPIFRADWVGSGILAPGRAGIGEGGECWSPISLTDGPGADLADHERDRGSGEPGRPTTATNGGHRVMGEVPGRPTIFAVPGRPSKPYSGSSHKTPWPANASIPRCRVRTASTGANRTSGR